MEFEFEFKQSGFRVSAWWGGGGVVRIGEREREENIKNMDGRRKRLDRKGGVRTV